MEFALNILHVICRCNQLAISTCNLYNTTRIYYINKYIFSLCLAYTLLVLPHQLPNLYFYTSLCMCACFCASFCFPFEITSLSPISLVKSYNFFQIFSSLKGQYVENDVSHLKIIKRATHWWLHDHQLYIILSVQSVRAWFAYKNVSQEASCFFVSESLRYTHIYCLK